MIDRLRDFFRTFLLIELVKGIRQLMEPPEPPRRKPIGFASERD